MTTIEQVIREAIREITGCPDIKNGDKSLCHLIVSRLDAEVRMGAEPMAWLSRNSAGKTDVWESRDSAWVRCAPDVEPIPLYAAPQPAIPGWRPIESAPKDGTWTLLFGGKCDGDEGDKHRVVVGQYTNYLNARETDWHWQFAWYDGGYSGVYEAPTHWAPLPPPPSGDAGKEGW